MASDEIGINVVYRNGLYPDPTIEYWADGDAERTVIRFSGTTGAWLGITGPGAALVDDSDPDGLPSWHEALARLGWYTRRTAGWPASPPAAPAPPTASAALPPGTCPRCRGAGVVPVAGQLDADGRPAVELCGRGDGGCGGTGSVGEAS